MNTLTRVAISLGHQHSREGGGEEGGGGGGGEREREREMGRVELMCTVIVPQLFKRLDSCM